MSANEPQPIPASGVSPTEKLPPAAAAPQPAVDERALAAALKEARRIKGVSLWQDAMRRLRRNWVAMLALVTLIFISLIAVLTPLLPLQSPIEQRMPTGPNNQGAILQPPNFRPVELTIKNEISFKKELARFDERIAELRDEIASARTPGARTAAEKKLATEQRANPVLEVWNKPSWIDRRLIRWRIAMFGDYCIPSICGTDALARDELARLCWGSRVSLMVGLVATLVSLVIGMTYGAVSGYLGGTTDNLMMRIVDMLYSIPFIFVVIFAITVLSQDHWKAALESLGVNQIVVFYLLIGAIYWLTMARVVRGQVISLKHEQFIEAARVAGASRTRIIFRHILPNVMSVVIVYLTLTIPAVMLFEAFLSFLGLGVSPPDVSWGVLANEGIKVITPIRIYWWLIVFPGAALALTLMSLNFLGDGLRDALDPRLKNQ